MEIKTCEQYVLAELKDAKEQIDSLNLSLESAKAEVEHLRYVLKAIEGMIEYRVTQDGTKQFQLDVWDCYDVKEFKLLTEIFPNLVKDKKDVENEDEPNRVDV